MTNTDLVLLDNGSLSVGISPLGAELQFIRTAAGLDLLWHGDAAFWTGRAPILFPIVGRGPDDQIAVDGHLVAMKQHGFARRSQFTLAASGPDFARFILTDSDESRALYPFAFEMAITYRLDGASLSVAVDIRNDGEVAMPFGLGFHPAFAWPLPGAGQAPHVITLDNGAEPALARLQGGYLAPERHASPFTDGRLTLDHALFEDDAMIFPEGSGTGLRYEAPGTSAPVLQFTFENTPNLGIWTKPDAPFLCIEPWHGMAARLGAGPEIAERPSSVSLAPGNTAHFGYSVTISDPE